MGGGHPFSHHGWIAVPSGVEMTRVEKGAVLPSLQRVLELSEALAIPVAQLLTESSPREEDFSSWLGERLQKLSEEDRSRVLDLIDRLTR